MEITHPGSRAQQFLVKNRATVLSGFKTSIWGLKITLKMKRSTPYSMQNITRVMHVTRMLTDRSHHWQKQLKETWTKPKKERSKHKKCFTQVYPQAKIPAFVTEKMLNRCLAHLLSLKTSCFYIWTSLPPVLQWNLVTFLQNLCSGPRLSSQRRVQHVEVFFVLHTTNSSRNRHLPNNSPWPQKPGLHCHVIQTGFSQMEESYRM